MIHVAAHDGAKLSDLCSSLYDRVLVDAPCTGDRHLMLKLQNTPRRFESPVVWDVEQVKYNSRRQQRLLHAALSATKPGGIVLYSTCALSEEENDGTVAAVLCNWPEVVIESAPEALRDLGEATKYGTIILPDTCKYGWGPIYFAILLVQGESTTSRSS